MKGTIRRILGIFLCIAMLAGSFLPPLGAMAEEPAAPEGFERWTPYVSSGKIWEDVSNITATESDWAGAFENTHENGFTDNEGMIGHGWNGNNSGMIYSKERYTDFEMTFDYRSPDWDNIYIGIGASKQGSTFSNQDTGLYSLLIGCKGNVNLRNKTGSTDNWISGELYNQDPELANFKKLKHSMRIRVVNKKITVYIRESEDGDWNERGTADLAEYNGGYIYLASYTWGGRFTAPVVNTDPADLYVSAAFKDFTPYNIIGTGWDTYYGGTSSEKMDNYDSWNVFIGKKNQESLMISHPWQGGTKAGYVFSNKSYKNFELTMQYYSTNDNCLYLGIGSPEMGKAPTESDNTGKTVFRVEPVGAITTLKDGKNEEETKNWNWVYTDETKNNVHTLKLVVSDGYATLYLMNDSGEWSKRVNFDLGENYQGGYIYIKSGAPEVRFSAPKIENLDNKNFGTDVTESLTSYSKAYEEVNPFTVSGLNRDNSISDNWYLDSDNLIHKLPNGKPSVLYLNTRINQLKRITFQYKSARSGNSYQGLFIGVGAKEMDGNFYYGDGGSQPQILRIWNKSFVQSSPRGYNENVPVDGWVDSTWEFAGADRDAIHTMTLEIKYNNIYIWMDGKYKGTHKLYDFSSEDSYLFLGGWDSAIAFSVPTVETIELTQNNIGDGYKGKSALFIGDSISYGALDRAAWAERLAYHYGLNITNASVGGAIISGQTITDGDHNLPLIQTQLDANKNNTYDYVVIEGGINDILWNQRGSDGGNKYCELGTISDSYDSAAFASKDTFAGGLEYIFYNVAQMKDSSGNTPKAAYIMVYKTTWGYKLDTANQYVDTVKKLCEKWGITLFNFWENEEFNTMIHNDTDKYLPDGLHVSHDGYEEMFKIIGDSNNGVLQTAKAPNEIVTVTVTASTENGTEVAGANLTGGSKYKKGQEVTVTAPAEDPDNHEFMGWYEDGKLLSRDRTYSFTANKNYELIAMYNVVGSGTITVKYDTVETSYTKNLGQKLTITAAGEGFQYWTNAYNMIVSRDSKYTFTVIASDTLTAHYQTEVQKSIVVWQSDYDQVIRSGEYGVSDGIVEPEKIPTKLGYTATGWSLNVDEIRSKITAGDKLITVKPKYTLNAAEFTITVKDGTLNKENATSANYTMNELVTVTAVVPEGRTFSYWKVSGTNTILGYAPVYQFYATQNYNIEAVFDADETAKGTATVVQVLRDEMNTKLSFVAMLTVPEGCTIEFGGILATNDSGKAGNLTRENADYVRGVAYKGTTLRYTWTKGKITDPSEVWYVRPYVVYRDANGVRQEILGAMVDEALSGQTTAGTLAANELPVTMASY